MRKRPFLLLACMFLAGVQFGAGRAWYALPLAMVVVVYARPWQEKSPRRGLLFLLIFTLFAAGALRAEGESRLQASYLPELEDGQQVRLVGEITRIEERERCVCYRLTDCVMDRSNEYMPCNDVLAYASSDEFSIGQILVITGTISLFEPAANEGGFDVRSYYQSQKIDFGVWVDTVEAVHGTGNRYSNFLMQIRKRLSESIAGCQGTDGILSAMLLGEKSQLDEEIKSLYRLAGIGHILAISGLHVTMLGIGLYRLLRRCGVRYASCAVFVSFVMLSYGWMTGGSMSTCRAVGMLLVYLLADVLGRGYDMLSALGLVVIVLLWDNPFLIHYSGFWLSVVAVLGVGVTGPVLVGWSNCFHEHSSILYEGTGIGEKAFERYAIGRKAAERKRDKSREFGKDEVRKTTVRRRREKSWKDKCRESLLMGLGIQITMLPLVALYYYELPIYALFLNSVVLMFVKYVVGVGGVAAVAGVWYLGLGTIIMKPCNWILGLYQWACELTLSLPGARVITGCPAKWQIVLYYIMLGIFLWVLARRTEFMRKQREDKQDRYGQGKLQEEKRIELLRTREIGEELQESLRGRGLEEKKEGMVAGMCRKREMILEGRRQLMVCTWLIFMISVILFHPLEKGEVDILDVGQGDGSYVCTVNGTTMFIDGGSLDVPDVGDNRILPFLKYKGVKGIDYWFVSHTDQDHISGLTEVLESGYPVRHLVFAAAVRENEKTVELAGVAQEAGTKVVYMQAGDVLVAGSARLRCLYPTAGEQREDINELSLVLRLEEDGSSCLFTGDISSEVEKELLASGAIEEVDFLKAAHHGSKYSNSYEFLQALQPKIVSISCGENNRYGHPGEETLERLNQVDSKILRTDQNGEIRIMVKASDVEACAMRGMEKLSSKNIYHQLY